MKKRLKWSQLKVGMIVLGALGILLITILFAGSIGELFVSRVEIKAYIDNIRGLREGNPVWFSGIEVGSVKRIRLDAEYGTSVILSIKSETLPFLSKDTKASVHTQGLLGDKFVELSPGMSSSPPLTEDDTIHGTAVPEIQDVVEVGSVSLVTLTRFLQRLEEIIDKIDRGEGTLAKLINDPSLYDNLKESTAEFQNSMKEIKQARGTIGKLLYDDTIYEDLKVSVDALKDFTTNLREKQGTLRYLIDDPSLYEKLLSASTSLEHFTNRLDSGDGTMTLLMEDPSLYNNLNETAVTMKRILQNVEGGEGIAGYLVKDTEMKQTLSETLDEMEGLIKDIRSNPGKYFHFSLF